MKCYRAGGAFKIPFLNVGSFVLSKKSSALKRTSAILAFCSCQCFREKFSQPSYKTLRDRALWHHRWLCWHENQIPLHRKGGSSRVWRIQLKWGILVTFYFWCLLPFKWSRQGRELKGCFTSVSRFMNRSFTFPSKHLKAAAAFKYRSAIVGFFVMSQVRLRLKCFRTCGASKSPLLTVSCFMLSQLSPR